VEKIREYEFSFTVSPQIHCEMALLKEELDQPQPHNKGKWRDLQL